VSRPLARGQANLPALAVALLLVTTAAGLGVALADGAFASAERDPRERHVAVSLSERLVAADGPLTTRGNVLNRSRVAALDADGLVERFSVADGSAFRVRVGNGTVAERGDPTGGTTVSRVVLLERRTATTLPAVPGDRVTLPRRTPRATLEVDPPATTTVRTVRANGRVVLHDPDGLDGRYDVALSRFETTTLAYEHAGPLPAGAVTVTYYPARTTKHQLVVTVDA
jgi:hypothetical protein